MKLTKNIPARTIERMVLYKRLLSDLLSKGQKTLFSHQLAALAHNTPAQVRRDIMTIGHEGSPHKGYDIASLITRITVILDGSKDRSIALVGVGNLGRAILSYFTYRHPGLTIVAAFDTDDSKVDRVISGCRCYHIRDFEQKVKELDINVGIITVPAGQAQAVADSVRRNQGSPQFRTGPAEGAGDGLRGPDRHRKLAGKTGLFRRSPETA